VQRKYSGRNVPSPEKLSRESELATALGQRAHTTPHGHHSLTASSLDLAYGEACIAIATVAPTSPERMDTRRLLNRLLLPHSSSSGAPTTLARREVRLLGLKEPRAAKHRIQARSARCSCWLTQ
jgi:hypothetical protein